MKKRLYDEYIKRLIEVNDETKSKQEHINFVHRLRGWREGVEDATRFRFNGDFYYLDLIKKGLIEERPMCCGEFLDWKEKQ